MAMWGVLALVLFWLVIQAALLLWGIGVGLLLHWAWPRVDVGTGALMAMLSGVISLYCGIRIVSALAVVVPTARDEEGDESPVVILPPRQSAWQPARRKPRRARET